MNRRLGIKPIFNIQTETHEKDTDRYGIRIQNQK